MHTKSEKVWYLRRILISLLLIGLVFSFGLHSLQIPHGHFGAVHVHGDTPEVGTVELNEYMHLADKKLLAIFLVVFLAPWTFLASPVVSRRKLALSVEQRTLCCLRTLHRMWNTTFEYFNIFFRKGILHTKAF